MINRYGAAIGGAVGGYSQYDDEDPGLISMGMGTAVGAGAGYAMEYSMPGRPVGKINDGLKVGSLRNHRARKAESALSKRFDSVMGEHDKIVENMRFARNEINQLHSRKRALSSAEQSTLYDLSKSFDSNTIELKALRDRVIGNVNQTMGTGTISGLNDLKSLKSSYGHADVDAMNKLSSALSFRERLETYSGVNGFNLATGERTLPTAVISANGTSQSKLGDLTNYFEKTLGNDSVTAARKAGTYVDKFSDWDMKMEGNTLSLSNMNGQKLSVPLTSHGDGYKYTMSGNTRVVSKSFNPHGEDYVRGLATFKEVTTKYDPEELIKYAGDDYASLRKTVDSIKGLSEYQGSDALRLHDSSSPSDLAIRKSNTLEMGLTLRTGSDGDTRLVNMNRVGSGNYETSMSSRMMTKLSQEGSYNPMSGVGTNSVTQVMSPDAPEIYQYAPLPFEEGGSSSVNVRSHKPTGQGVLQSPALANTPGGEALAKNSIQGKRIDVSGDLSDAIAKMFGGNITLDDGYSLFNEKYATDFASEEDIRVRLPNFGDVDNPKYKTTLDINRVLEAQSFNTMMNEMGIGSADLSVNLPSGDIGITEDGRKIKIGSQYSHMNVNRVSKGADGTLELIGKGVYTPEMYDWMKVFSSASKSGGAVIPEHMFNTIAAMGVLEAEGTIKVSDGKIMGKVPKNLSNRARKRAKKSGRSLEKWVEINSGRIKQLTAGVNIREGSFMISRFDDTGQGDIGKALRSEGGLKAANAARLESALSANKASGDIWQTMKEHSYGQGKASEVDEWKGILQNGTAKQKLEVKGKVSGLIDEVWNTKGNIYTDTTVTPSMGAAVTGAGNTGSSSWLEQLQLSHSGVSREILSQMADADMGSILEADMIINSSKAGTFNTSGLKGKEHKLASLFDLTAEARGDKLKTLGIDVGADTNYLSYDLNVKSNGMQSVSIPLVDTGYSGTTKVTGEPVKKLLDRYRQDLIQKDIEYGKALSSGSVMASDLKQDVVDSARALSDKQASLAKTITKSATKLSSDRSKIMTASPVHGEATDFLKRTQKHNSMFLSEVEGKRLSKRMGYEDFKMEGVSGNEKIKRAMVKVDGNWQPMLNQIVREPAQGPFSSITAETFIDTSIKKGGKDQIFFGASLSGGDGSYKSLMGNFASLDHDADAIRVLGLNSLSMDSQNVLKDKTNKAIGYAEQLANLQDKIKVKGAENHVEKSVLSFKSNTEMYEHLTAAATKGRYRKPIAAEVTRLSVMMAEALDRNPSLVGEAKMEEKLAARQMVYNLTENMLKSKHTDTEKFVGGYNGPMEKFRQHEKNWAQAGYGEGNKGFEKGLRDVMHEALGSQRDSMSTQTRQMYDTAIDNISNSFMRHGGEIVEADIVPIDVSKYAMNKNPGEYTQGMVDVLTQAKSRTRAGHVEGVEAPMSTKIKKGGKQMYDEASSAIMRTAKKNWKLLAGTGAALGVIASVSGARQPTGDVSAASQPSPGKAPLQPLRDRKAYVTKYKESGGYDIRADVKTARNNLRPDNISQVLFGDDIGSTNINITDKSGMF